jgi:hypothetical protein
MNKSQYKQNRRLLRDNGTYALRWMSQTDKQAMTKLVYQSTDILAERAAMLCERQLAVWLTTKQCFIDKIKFSGCIATELNI